MNAGTQQAGRFADQVVVITGAGNGIGRACALRFAAQGAAVVAADLQPGPLATTVADIEAAGGRAIAVALDATSPADNEAMAAAAIDAFGRLDLLITAAGISHSEYRSGDLENDLKYMMSNLENVETPWRTFLELEVDAFRKVIDVNLTGTWLAMQACCARMVDSGRGGAVVTIASIAAKDPDAGPLAYTVSKAGVWMLTKKSARELAGAKIRVNSIGPGFIDTNMTQLIKMMPPERAEQLLAKIPMGRTGHADEIAKVAAFLCSDDASYMTGELLHPDGGWFTD